MPLYTDQGYYYSGGSSQLYAPYYTPGLYVVPASSSGGSYAPYSSTYNRTFGSSYILPLAPPRTSSYTSAHSLSSRYQPKLSTITETSPLISARHGGVLPLTRIQSPKVSSYSAPTTSAGTKYVPPRPIPINTADIDVSSSRYAHHKHEEEKEKEKIQQHRDVSRDSVEKKQSGDEEEKVEAQVKEYKSARSTIKRDRPVVRLSTIRSRSRDRNRATKSTSSGTDDSPEPKTKVFKDLPTIEPLHTTETQLSWRQKLAEELADVPTYPVKKSPGELMRERYLIQDSITDKLNLTPSRRAAPAVEDVTEEQMRDPVVVELDLDPANNSIRGLSIPQYPTFHDICEDISSDKIDDDLNAGELRRRASLIQEQEQEILNQLQKSPSGTFQLIHLERRESQDSTSEEGHRKSTKKRASKKGKKIRHKITAVVEVDNASLLPVLQEKEELTPTPTGREPSPIPKFTFNVESVEEHHEIHKVFKLPKRKSVKKVMKPKEIVLPEGFMQASPKSKVAPKANTPKKKSFVSNAEIFTFEPIAVELSSEIEPHESTEKITNPKIENQALNSDISYKSVLMINIPLPKEAVITALEPSLSVDASTENLNANTSDRATEQFQSQIISTKLKAPTVKPLSEDKIIPKEVKEIKSNPIEKSDSGEDFWAQIGKRESVYMTNRKKGQLENQWQKREDLLESQAAEAVSNIKQIKTAVSAQKKEALKKADQDISKINEKGVVGRSQSTESAICKKEKKDQKDLKEIGSTASKPMSKEPLPSAQKSSTEVQLGTEKAPISATKTPTVSTTATTTTQVSTATTASPTATSAATKINFGQIAKSPEQQANKFTTQADNDNEKTKLFISQTGTASATSTTIKTTSTTTPTSTTPKSVTASADRNAKKTEKLTTTPKLTEAHVAGTSTSTSVTTTITKIATQSASESKKTEVKTDKQKEANVNADPADKNNVAIKSLPTSPIAPPSASGIVLVATDTKPRAVPKTATVGKPKTSPREAPQSPINADQFLSVAPPKTATSPTKGKMTSPQNTKPKAKPTTTPSATKPINNNEVNEKVVKTKISAATAIATPTTPIASIAKVATTAATAITATTPATKIPNTASTTPSTLRSSSTAADTPPVPIATELLERHKNHEDANGSENNQQQKAHAPNNLSKFATVLNLAQCLKDVDADLEDYVPSSAENSDDEDSSYDYSSADDCDYQNLSASMKKKLRQRRKKEKQAEQARFDPQKKIKIDPSNKCYVKEEAPRYPLVATPRPLWKREKIVYPDEESDEESGDSDESGSGSEETEDSEECTTSEEYEDDLSAIANGAASGSNVSKENSAIIRLSTCSNDSGFEGGTAPSSPKKMLGAREAPESPSTPPSSNPVYKIEGNDEQDETSYTYSQFQKSGRFTAPATVIPRFKNYSVDDFHFLAVLGKGSFGKVLLAELRDTTYYYAVKCLKKDVVLEDDDVDSTLIERKVLALGTKHPYLCHLFCTFQTESHLFFVMEYLNGGDLMFHIQESGRFPEERARFYGAEIISGLKFLHKKGIIYRDLKLDNVLLDYEGHVRIADFGMCKLQIYLDKTADSFCGTPDYMAPEIIKGEKYNQNVDWWSFGVLLYEMLIGQSPFSGCDEDELFWSICNEIPWFPVYISAEATGILKGLLEKDYTRRIGSQYSPAGDISEHIFFRPIDWDLLEKRQLPPPFKPLVKHPLDTQYFDRVFTKERVRLTPIEKEILQSMDQKPFLGFTYTNPHITLD